MPFQKIKYKAHIPNIHALNSDTHTLRIQYEYTEKQCMGVAIEGMDIWYIGLTNFTNPYYLPTMQNDSPECW